jgi:hypothetical protein
MIRVPILLSGKTGTFSEISIKNLGHEAKKKKKGTYFKNQILHRNVATHTYTSALRPLHKTL